MSTHKNEHNPDNLTPEQIGEGWQLLTIAEVEHRIALLSIDATEEKVEAWQSGQWIPGWNGNSPRVTYRRRITPPTDTTGEPDPNCERCFGFGWIRRPAEGVRCTCCPDTTGSGREGETPTPESDNLSFKARLVLPEHSGAVKRVILHEDAQRLERQRDAALAQVEALRRDGERLDWLSRFFSFENVDYSDVEQASYWGWNISDDALLQALGGTKGMPDPIPTLRAAIDSAQRQEGAK